MPRVSPSEHHRFITIIRTHWAACLVGMLFLALSVVYNVGNPLWESDSEWSHYQYIRYIVTHRAMPSSATPIRLPESSDICQSLTQPTEMTPNQFRQPPLYYLMGAVATGWVPIEQELSVSFNPHLFISNAEGGYNVAVHTPAEDFPYRGTALAVHMARFLSSLMGLAGLIAVYLTGLLVFSQRRHLAAAMMATTAFIPQYVFSSSVINNDILAGCLGAWCIFLCVRAVVQRRRPVDLALIILVASLALLAKYSSLVLVPIVVVTILVTQIQNWRTGKVPDRAQIGKTVLLVGIACVPALVWFIRNKLVSGSFLDSYSTITDYFVQSIVLNPAGLTSEAALDPFHAARFVFITIWGLFGNDVLALPQWVLILLGLLCLVALAGLVLTLVDRRESSQLRLLIVAALIFIISAWLINLLKSTGTSEPRGRYLLPVYSIISFLLVAGFYRAFPRSLRDRGVVVLPACLFVLSAAIPFLVFRPTYAPPAVEAAADLLPGEEPVHVIFGDFAELVGYSVEPSRVGLFETTNVTLVWRSLRPTTNNYTVGVHLLDGANGSQGTVARFPGHGNYATSLWQPGEVFRDTYEVALRGAARDALPSLGRVKVSLYCYAPEGQAETYLPVTDSQGQSIGDAVYLGRLKLSAPEGSGDMTSAATPVLYRFGEEIGLEDAQLTPQKLPTGQIELSIDLNLQALAKPAHDYTVFVHLVDGAGNQVAGNDQPLTNGYYPSDLWDPGERIVHEHRLAVPFGLRPGTYALRVGLYDPESNTRLAVSDGGGAKQTLDEVDLGAYHQTGFLLFLPYVVSGSHSTR